MKKILRHTFLVLIFVGDDIKISELVGSLGVKREQKVVFCEIFYL